MANILPDAMTLRDWLAGQALGCGLLSAAASDATIRAAAEAAYRVADAMIEARGEKRLMTGRDVDETIDSIRGVRRAFGPPGDYGYSTPQGQALAALYDLHNRIVEAGL